LTDINWRISKIRLIVLYRWMSRFSILFSVCMCCHCTCGFSTSGQNTHVSCTG